MRGTAETFSAAGAQEDRAKRRNAYFRRMRRYRQMYLFLLLPVAYFVIFKYLPMWGAQIAFRKYDVGKGILNSEWVGLKYFIKFFGSYQFERVIKNTLTISLYSIAAGFPMPVLLALMLNCVKRSRLRKLSQNILYIPNFISVVVIVGMLMQLINPVVGLYAKIYGALNGGAKPADLMGIPSAFPHIYVWSGIWQSMGWDSVIYIAALSAVDPGLHEAAVIDGAGRFQRVLHVDFPALLPTVVIMLILRCGSIMSVGFEKAYLMQTDLNLRTSELISTYVYKQGITATGTGAKFSYATAIGLFNSVINLMMIALVNYFSRKVGETSLW